MRSMHNVNKGAMNETLFLDKYFKIYFVMAYLPTLCIDVQICKFDV